MTKPGSYPTLSSEDQKNAWSHCTDRLDVLNNQTRNIMEKVHKFLFLGNGGGAGATLAFLGVMKNSAPDTFRVSLVCFGFGLFLYGIYLAWLYQLFRKLAQNYADDMNNFAKGDLNLVDIYHREVSRNSKVLWGYILAYGSFILFLAGLIFGGLGA